MELPSRARGVRGLWQPGRGEDSQQLPQAHLSGSLVSGSGVGVRRRNARWKPKGADPSPLPRRYALLRIVNVEKRRDSARGSRFLLELELQERGGGRLRLSEYVFLRLPGARAGDTDRDGESPEPAPAASIRPDGRPELCRPLRLAWRQDVMVHFIVPGARECGGPRHPGCGVGFQEPS